MECDETVEPGMGDQESKRELRGWPLLFVLWLGVVGPIYSLALNGFFAVRWGAMYPGGAYYYASWHFWWFIAARELSRIAAATTMLFWRSTYSVWIAISVLWLSGPTLVTATWLMAGYVAMPGALIRSTAIAAAATIYLTRSRQIRTIYRSEAPDLDGSPLRPIMG